jgi:hypothetical protein
VSQKRIVRSLLFEETITAEKYQNLLTQSIVLLKQNKKIKKMGLLVSAMWGEWPHCENSGSFL